MKKLLGCIVLLIGLSVSVCSQDYSMLQNVAYYPDSVTRAEPDIKKECVLDVYYPAKNKGFATVVWFHGGGLTSGSKEIPDALKNKNLCVVGVNYRLYPHVGAPEYIKDAAAAVAWTFKNIAKLGGDPSLIFVSGHSAGGYLTCMVGLDHRWLNMYDVDARKIAGLIPFSGQMITHFTVRKERGIDEKQPVIDSLAPLYHVSAEAPPLLLITGDRELELLGRYEENAYMMRMMKIAGHKQTRLLELQGYGHDMTAPAFPLLIKEIERICKEKKINSNSEKK